jgi:hypothetical protein
MATIEKIDVLSRLSPFLEDDAEHAMTLSVLMDCINDYVGKLRRTLAAAAGGAE